jgi:iron uptake system component EfeO
MKDKEKRTEMSRIPVKAALCLAATLLLALFVVACGSGDGETTATSTTAAAETKQASPQEKAAVAQYRGYLEENTAELVAKTKPFVAAVVAGDVATAKERYPAARIPYERIEPVAGAFGDLDPRIDAREDGVPADEWGGFHRIEKALWVEGMAKGMAPVAKQLQADVEELDAKVKTVELDAVEIAVGANELLAEVSGSKITGEEERYSHIDLVDFEANVEGSLAAFEAVKPLLDAEDADLSGEIEADFKAVFNSLQPYRRGNGFVSYTELTKSDTRGLAREIDILAEELSQVPAIIDSNG